MNRCIHVEGFDDLDGVCRACGSPEWGVVQRAPDGVYSWMAVPASQQAAVTTMLIRHGDYVRLFSPGGFYAK